MRKFLFSNTSAKIASFGRWTAQKRGVFYLDRWAPKMKTGIIATVGILLAGCASGPVFQPEPAPAAEKSLLYIYREAATPFWMRTAVIAIDGKTIGELPNGGYLVRILTPGAHEIVQTWSNWIGDYSELTKPQKISINTSPGATHFVQFQLSARQEYRYRVTSWSLNEVSSTAGREGIKECKRQETQP